jgi:hypothetical protein
MLHGPYQRHGNALVILICTDIGPEVVFVPRQLCLVADGSLPQALLVC